MLKKESFSKQTSDNPNLFCIPKETINSLSYKGKRTELWIALTELWIALKEYSPPTSTPPNNPTEKNITKITITDPALRTALEKFMKSNYGTLILQL